ncbi:hypothetical protein HanXRQr2_Chr07g0300281 [Helianthus annuus]|uniref:Uncharacterized protein n=1 Tax=Helianthus annuus TaxID=4232 RepID=A0A9K3IM93_HELAN|nr:hypothetical protein HanXRQr2_Chr07g0300281 [Helianthus annuus]
MDRKLLNYKEGNNRGTTVVKLETLITVNKINSKHTSKCVLGSIRTQERPGAPLQNPSSLKIDQLEVQFSPKSKSDHRFVITSSKGS